MKKVMAILLVASFILSGGISLFLTTDSNAGSAVAAVTPLTAATMVPGTVPHYFGPYANYANSPVPKGPITSITVDTKGSGYTLPTVTISDVWGTGSGALASAVLVSGMISEITITNGGTGYSAPIVTITDSTGSGATATPVMGGTLTGGIRKFIDSLPGLTAAGANNLGNYIPVGIPDTTTFPGCDYYEIALVKYTQKMSTDLPATLLYGYVQLETPALASLSLHVALTNPDGTPILKGDGTQAYGMTKPYYLGPTIVASKDIPVRVTFSNLLPTGADGNLFLPVDTTVMGAGMGPNMSMTSTGMENYTENRATLHLHGGATPWISDGTPDQWTTPAGETTQYPKGVSVEYVPDMWFVNGVVQPGTVGQTTAPIAGATNDPGAGSLTFYYTNQQSARLMFYHDHAYGITRLNVYAGEAAGYLLTDAVENALIDAGILPSLPGAYTYGIPLIIQDKTFVDATTIAYQDPTWAWGSHPVNATNPTGTPTTGDLWAPHVYMPNQNPYDPTGANPYGRWDYGPWFFPPTPITVQPVTNPYYDPINAPWEPPVIPGVPNVSATMEAFGDTPTVNGEAYPYLDVAPQAYRFRVLNAANDRFFNLQFYVADPNVVTSDGRINTEVSMIPSTLPVGSSVSTLPYVPNPAYNGPDIIQIGTEGGFLPAPVVIPDQPITWNANMKMFTFGNVQDHSLLLGSAERADIIVDFSKYAGKTLILYNDAPAGFPAYDPRNDYFTGDQSQMSTGGAATTQAGYGPNTRTIMQIRVANMTAAPAYDLTALQNAFATTSTHTGVFNASQDPIIVPQAAYDSAYDRTFSNNAFIRLQDTNMTFTTLTGANVTVGLQQKAIHDEMGGSYDPIYGRMQGSLGIEVATGTAVTQQFIPLGYASPPVDLMSDSLIASSPVQADGTQIWKITHNGVDTHAVHWHLFNVQLINRVGWDGAIITPDANELGWKDTVRVDPLSITYVALRPISMILPWEVPSSYRLIDPTKPAGVALDPPPGGFFDPNAVAVTPVNKYINYGWEYVWHCHLLEHEEMDMMHSMAFGVAPYAPTGLSSTLNLVNNSWVNLTWMDNSIAETAYIVQMSYNSSPFFTIGTVASPHDTTGMTKGNMMYFNTTVVLNTTVYSFRVMANEILGDPTNYSTTSVYEGYPTLSVNSTASNLRVFNTATLTMSTVNAVVVPPRVLKSESFYLIPPGSTATSYTTVFASLSAAMAANPRTAVTYANNLPIRINSNADFNVAHGVTGGAGTALNPWIIENLNIDGTGYGYGIYVGNTTDYFIIRNCKLSNATGGYYAWDYAPDSGLVFFNVVNGIAANNIMTTNAWSGIYAINSANLMVFNETLAGNYYGIYLRSTNNSIVSFNTLSSNYIGAWLFESNSNTFGNDTITHNYQGIMLVSSTWNTFDHNTLFANNGYGIHLLGSTNNLVFSNDFINNNGATTVYSAAHIQAFDNANTNLWNGATRGNYWNDLIAPDQNGDGIVDVAYPLAGGAGARDNFPLTTEVIVDLISSIVVTPTTVNVVAGTAQSFTAAAYNQFGNIIPEVVTWSVAPNLGAIDPTGGLLTATTLAGGVGYVTASFGTVSGNATVTIVPGTLNHISMTPSSLTIVRGLSETFYASGQDVYDNPIAGLTYVWTATVGIVTSTGPNTAFYTAQNVPGSGYLNATNGGKTGSVNITVLFGQLTYIKVIPATANVAAGTNMTFTATGYDAFNNLVTGLPFTWTTNLGTMNGSKFTAQTEAGVSGYVKVTSGLVNASAAITITPAGLDHIDLLPSSMLNTIASSQHQFTAIGRDVYNNSIPGLTYTWATDIGSISSAGLFTAQSVAGASGHVNASSGGKIGSANVSITFSQLTYILVTPKSVNVSAGKHHLFSAIGYDQYNNSISDLTFSWTTDVGSMTDSNLTAQNTAGVTGYVRATSGVVLGSASVNIVPAALDHIDLTPSSLLNTVASSEHQFIAIGRDAYNNSISGLTYSWTTNIGKVSSTGLFTAQASSGAQGHVNASNASTMGSAAVSITFGQLTYILLTPSVSDVVVGQDVNFSAVGYDIDNNSVSGLTFTWSTNIGTMNGSVLKPSTISGQSGYVRATSGVVVSNTFVRTVPGVLDHIVVMPNIINISASKSIDISAIGYDRFNNTVSGLNFTWASNVGKVSGQTFTAQDGAGVTGNISATSGSVTGKNVVNIAPADYAWTIILVVVVAIIAGVGYVLWRRRS